MNQSSSISAASFALCEIIGRTELKISQKELFAKQPAYVNKKTIGNIQTIVKTAFTKARKDDFS